LVRRTASRRLILCAGLTGLAVPALAQERYAVVATVNDSAITAQELERRTAFVMVSSRLPDTPDNRKRMMRQVLDQMINERLQMQEAQRNGIAVSPQEVQARIVDIEKSNNMPAGGFKQYLRAANLPEQIMTDQIAANLAWIKVVRRKLRPSSEASDAEVDEQLRQLQSSVGQSENRVAEIFLAVDRPDQQEEVRRGAERIIQQLRGGAAFPALAQQFSQGSTANSGGDLGWLLPGQLEAPLEQAVARLAPRTMTDNPVRGASGWHVLLLIDRRVRAAGQLPSRDEVYNSLVQQKLEAGARRLMRDLRRSALIDIKVRV
jgi:peptidyl-prolyl cis-trans isomerase SurA